MAKTKALARIINAMVIAACVGMTLGCAVIVSLILALCGASAWLIAAVIVGALVAGVWLGLCTTHPYDDPFDVLGAMACGLRRVIRATIAGLASVWRVAAAAIAIATVSDRQRKQPGPAGVGVGSGPSGGG